MPTTVHPSGRSTLLRTSETTPATATGNTTAREQEHVDDELRPRLIAPARRRIDEPMQARPAMACLPDQVRDEQRDGDHHGQRKAPRMENIPAPDQEGSDEQHEDDSDRVLRLEPDTGSDSEQRPRTAAECEPKARARGRPSSSTDRTRPVGRAGSWPSIPGAKPIHGGERLPTARRPEFASNESTHQHRSRARENRDAREGQRGRSRTALRESAASSAVTGGNSTYPP